MSKRKERILRNMYRHAAMQDQLYRDWSDEDRYGIGVPQDAIDQLRESDRRTAALEKSRYQDDKK